MALLVLSDTHGLTDPVQRLVERALAKKSFDHIVHCGDFCCDRKQAPFTRMIQVRGNCDTDTSVPEEQIVEWRGLRVLVVHGHKQNVKTSSLNLKYFAQERKANLVLFGHTHVLTCTESGGTLFVNPGSLAKPRHFPLPTFAVVDRIGEKQGEHGADKVEIKVSFFDHHFRRVAKKGGTFAIPLTHHS